MSDRKIIGFVGRAGSGKSTASARAIAAHGFQRGTFARALKLMLRTLLNYRGADAVTINRMVDGDLKEIPSSHLNGKSPRVAMQTLGSEWGRDCIDRDLWVDTEMDATRDLPRVVFDDVRFSNEVAAIRKAGGMVVRVMRPGTVNVSAHASEEVDWLECDATIDNDGSPIDLARRVDALIVGGFVGGLDRASG